MAVTCCLMRHISYIWDYYLGNIVDALSTYRVHFNYMSNKREKFVELATKRVNRAIKDLRLIGNLSNRSAYAYSDDDIRKVLRALQREVDAVKSRFAGPGEGGDSEFTL